MTKIEKQFLDAMTADPQAPHGLFNPNDPKDMICLREKMRVTAYHEAGHFVAKLFTGLEISHVMYVTIIPEHGAIGHIKSDTASTEQNIGSYFYGTGIMLLLEKLAGYGTEIILDQFQTWDSIFEYAEFNHFCEGFEDLPRAVNIAERMTKPYMPAHRILKLADKWTLEMLRIPKVWNTIEYVAGKLIKQGKITKDKGELDAIRKRYDGFGLPDIVALQKWRRRIHESFSRP